MYRRFFKRFSDVTVSITALAFFMPLMVLLALTGGLIMRENPFFVQKRPGRKQKSGIEKQFYIIKFKSMPTPGKNTRAGEKHEKRATSYGRALRRSSLDELPQLLNIIAGDMSLVGPRPLLNEYLEFYTERERRRHEIRPGLTGLAQISGRNDIDLKTKLEYDVEYVDSLSFLLDVKIILITIVKVVKRVGIAPDGCSKNGRPAGIKKQK